MTTRTSTRLTAAAATLFICLAYITAHAEPYFAVREGMKCANCHTSPSGGGMRNAVGNSWAQTALPQLRIEVPAVEPWTGAVNRYLSIGGNLGCRSRVGER